VDLSVVSLICFVGITVGVIAALMLIRDLYAPADAIANRGFGGSGRNLRRMRTVFDEAPARSVTGRLDQAFDRLVLESGFDTTPIGAFLLLLACGLLVGGLLWTFYGHLLTGIAGMLLGMVATLILLIVKRMRRRNAILNQLPYVLDLFARAVRAGESVDQAIDLIGNEVGGVLGKEFAQCSRQLEMGRSLETVVKSFAARVRLVELRILSTTLIVHRQTGGNLADTLERMSDVVRDRLSAQRQMKAASGAARASTLLIATISPVAYLIMFLWQPEHVGVLYTDPLGVTLLILAMVLETVGIFWVLYLLRQES